MVTTDDIVGKQWLRGMVINKFNVICGGSPTVDEVDDILSRVYVRLHKQGGQFKWGGEANSWAAKAVAHSIIDQRRQVRQKRSIEQVSMDARFGTSYTTEEAFSVGESLGTLGVVDHVHDDKEFAAVELKEATVTACEYLASKSEGVSTKAHYEHIARCALGLEPREGFVPNRGTLARCRNRLARSLGI